MSSWEEFMDTYTPIMNNELKKAKLNSGASKLAKDFLRVMFDEENLRETPEKSCHAAIFSATVYYANVVGVDPLEV